MINQMGYVSKDIAVITEPKIVTLAAVPNFVEFASKPAAKTYLELNLQVKGTQAASIDAFLLRVDTEAGEVFDLKGTTDLNEVGGSVFYVSTDVSETAENIREALLANSWLSANFEIVIPFVWVGDQPANGDTINIKSKGAGNEFNIDVTAPNDPVAAVYTIGWVNPTSSNGDSLIGDQATAEVELDIYFDPAIFLGQDDRPLTPAKLGTYSISLQKTYAGVPVWFELNGLFSQYGNFNTPVGKTGWFDTGTLQAYRFVAKLKTGTAFSFYQSNALFVLNGYGRLSESVDLADYVYNDQSVKLLTNKPRTPYVTGQKEYLNFIFEDPQRGLVSPIEFTLRIVYRAYTTSGDYIGAVYGGEQTRASFSMVNTYALDIDAALTAYPDAGIIKVALARGTAIISNDLEYLIRPECLHHLLQFTFLNKLGGWDVFNFDASIQDEIKPVSETYTKTVTPAFTKGDSVETIYSTSLDNTLTVEGAPVTDEVAAWLKELAAARAVLDGEGNYIIIEDFTLKVNAATFNMQVPVIKYRLSETYTND